MSFTKQDMVDWALSRKAHDPEDRLILVALAMNADEAGDGELLLGRLSVLASCDPLELLGRLAMLRSRGFIVFNYKTNRGASYEQDMVTYGLCIDMGGAY